MASFSIYSSSFNLLKNNFDYKSSIKNFCSFAEEVIIAVNRSSDETFRFLQLEAENWKNLKIFPCDFSYSDPLLDGKIKNFALSKTTNPYKIGLDMDERIPLRHRDRWETLAAMMDETGIDSCMIPSLNLWGDLFSVKSGLAENLGKKWYLHKGGLFRGPVNFAKKSDGTVDTSKSDTCELVDSQGNLARSISFGSGNFENLQNYLDFLEEKLTFVYHLGYASYSDRITRNKNFWKKHWEVESGGIKPTHKVHEKMEEFTETTVPHNLKLWHE
jgi:hypothetical protein